jgi:hypothetical protein
MFVRRGPLFALEGSGGDSRLRGDNRLMDWGSLSYRAALVAATLTALHWLSPF